ncbi:hypothetical protein DPEC_G00378960 [Dallia pectoralis]|nr:hypothetical protein DPEC_G00378960 [Dallia pectoralis]
MSLGRIREPTLVGSTSFAWENHPVDRTSLPCSDNRARLNDCARLGRADKPHVGCQTWIGRENGRENDLDRFGCSNESRLNDFGRTTGLHFDEGTCIGRKNEPCFGE